MNTPDEIDKLLEDLLDDSVGCVCIESRVGECLCAGKKREARKKLDELYREKYRSAIPSECDKDCDNFVQSYSEGWNDCRAEMIKRIEGER
jgi:hypothetical protein